MNDDLLATCPDCVYHDFCCLDCPRYYNCPDACEDDYRCIFANLERND